MKFSATGMVYFSLSGKERLRRKLKEKEFLEMFFFFGFVLFCFKGCPL